MKPSPTPCALCRKPGVLVMSHIIPAFVFRWSKETSITGYLRNGENPRRRHQDGLKVPLLCASCEAMLSAWEARFATEIFHPYNADAGLHAPYGDWMLKFCVSVSWRTLRYMMDEYGLKDWSALQQASAVAALERWRAFMFDEVPHPGIYEQNLLPLSVLSSSTIPNMPTNMNRYLARAIDMDLAHAEQTAFAYSKMGRFALFGMVVPTRQKWKGARIAVRGGVIQPRHFEVPFGVADYIMNRARATAKLAGMIPEHQADKIEAEFMRNPDRVAKSDQFAAMVADADMFGESAIIRKTNVG